MTNATLELLTQAAVAIAAFAAMEGIAWSAHRYLMHGALWDWHRSHHEPGPGGLERNDRFAVIFAILCTIGFAIGPVMSHYAFAACIGVVLYGIAYVLLHDGLVHQRLPVRWIPRGGYLGRLVTAHHLHHAVRSQHGAVSFGFVYAPPLPHLRSRLRANAGAVKRQTSSPA